MDPVTLASEPPLRVRMDLLIAALHAHVPRALDDWDPEAIHQARVATRRLKAALDLLKPVVGKKRRKPLAKALRRLRRRLGPLRDADVMLERLDALAASPKHAAAVEWLATHVRSERDELRAESRKGGSSADVIAGLDAWRPLRERVGGAAGVIPGLLADSLRTQLDAFTDEVGRVVCPAGRRHDPHQVRIAGKALRYTLEMADAQGFPVPAGALKTFKRMQDLLGAWHDDVVLADKSVQVCLDTQLSHRDPALQEKVLDLVRAPLRRSAGQLARFGSLWSEQGAELSATILAALPAAPSGDGRAVTGSQTGPGPTRSPDTSAPEASLPGEPSAAS